MDSRRNQADVIKIRGPSEGVAQDHRAVDLRRNQADVIEIRGPSDSSSNLVPWEIVVYIIAKRVQIVAKDGPYIPR